jgi:ankyrin repeat protein
VLELLYAHGMGTGDGGVWAQRLGEVLPSPADLLAELLQHAAESGLERRVRLLLDHHADPNRRARHPIYAGRSPYAGAMRNGNRAIAALLAQAGADVSGVDAVDHVRALAMAGDPSAAADPGLVAEAIERDPTAIVRAAALGRRSAIRLMVALGWDIDVRERGTALHEAAWLGDRELVDELLALGADPSIRDFAFGGTPAGWAHHGGHADLATHLDALANPI